MMVLLFFLQYSHINENHRCQTLNIAKLSSTFFTVFENALSTWKKRTGITMLGGPNLSFIDNLFRWWLSKIWKYSSY
jgi:hypothetical protein